MENKASEINNLFDKTEEDRKKIGLRASRYSSNEYYKGQNICKHFIRRIEKGPK